MDIDQLVVKAREIYSKEDSFAAIMYLSDLQDPEITMDALSGLMHHQYWQEKDLVGALAFGRAGIQFGLQSALENDVSQPELAHKLRSNAKGTAYDFASLPRSVGMSQEWRSPPPIMRPVLMPHA